MSYTSELRQRLCKVISEQLGQCLARDILRSDFDLLLEEHGYDSDTRVAPESKQVFLKIAELSVILSSMADRVELRELRSKVRTYHSPMQPPNGAGRQVPVRRDV